jgi:hypothetical protein
MSRALGYLAAVIVLATSAAAHCASAETLKNRGRDTVPPGANASALSGAQIGAQVIGNSITGVDSDNGESYTEYLKPDGTISGIEDSGAYSGSWRIVNNKLCFHYDDNDGDSEGWDCTPVTLVGTNVYWSNEVSDGDSVEATLLRGNPKNL